jgi:hypothetical protein
LEYFHQVAPERSLEELMQLDEVVTQFKKKNLQGKHGVAWRIQSWQLTCVSLLLEQEGHCVTDGS